MRSDGGRDKVGRDIEHERQREKRWRDSGRREGETVKGERRELEQRQEIEWEERRGRDRE